MNSPGNSPSSIRLAAVGDLLLAPPLSEGHYPRKPELVNPAVCALFDDCDVVFGNLEFTLPGDGRQVSYEPRVIGTTELVRAVRHAGITLVTLANNHTFDCYEPGFERMRRLLAELQLPHFGAGMNISEATAPALMEVNGLKLAFVGAVDERSGASQFATIEQAGVAMYWHNR